MLRRLFIPEPSNAEPWRIRGASPGRLENFSDCTFAFSLTFLIFALEAPRSYPELLRIMPGFFSFAASFAILTMLWYRHVQYFRRYALHDRATVAMNTALLALILFYLQPLKLLMNTAFAAFGYLFVRLFVAMTGGPKPARPVMLGNPGLMPRVLAIYLIGFGAVAVLYTLMYRHALAKKDELELSAFEEGATRDDMTLWAFVAVLVSAVAVLALALPPDWAGLVNFLVFGIPIFRARLRRRRREMLRAGASPSASA